MWQRGLALLLILLRTRLGFSELPGDGDWVRARDCGTQGLYLDFSASSASPSLDCVSSCPTDSEAVGAEICGDVPVCARPAGEQTRILQIGLRQLCQEASCPSKDGWSSYKQRITVNVAKTLGVPLSEVQSDLLFWTLPSGVESPSLSELRIYGPGERRLAQDHWYSVVLALRISSRRLDPRSAAIGIFEKNDTASVYGQLGVQAEVWSFQLSTAVAGVATPRDY